MKVGDLLIVVEIFQPEANPVGTILKVVGIYHNGNFDAEPITNPDGGWEFESNLSAYYGDSAENAPKIETVVYPCKAMEILHAL